ncbi:MAG: asparagine synthase (glutamine-hydrolyzing) [Chthoniobacter sp.]|nr:asparagine synthase (glutamine-hydrolyzing) [Chthoniobacter sp.]
MCGIAGFIDPSLSAEEGAAHLQRMLDLLAHRGPDGAGTYVAPGLGLGMRRLSIIDLEGGSQPIWNENESIGVVFNGEIYNYLELRRELIAGGHEFRTHTDTEVLVHLYEQLGDAMFAKLRGMFAFALLDTNQNRLLLARDHFGQKPLYYASNGERLAFASELKSLFTLPWVDRDRDPEAFLDYVSWLSLPSPRTHFRHIRKLPAGCFLSVPLRGLQSFEPHRYWRYELDEVPDLTALEPAVEELDACLRDSVKVHLRADVPVGVLLSSGLDSRVVTTYAQELQEGKMQTFSVGFGGPDSEAQGAAITAREIGAKHHGLELTSDDLLHNIERIAWHLDEPVGDPAAFAVLKVCEFARGHVKVLLSGEGSDELFAGYDARYLGIMATLKRSEKLRRFAPLVPAADPASRPSRWQRLGIRTHHTRASEAVTLRIEGLPGDVRRLHGLTADQLRRLRRRADTIAESVYRPQRDVLSELLALDLDWQLAESLLQKADKMSMGASIELRTPILDVRVAALAARMSSSLKLPPAGPGKLVLRHCLSRKIHEPLDRPKRGFPVPLRDWFQGPLREPLEAALFASDSACLAQLDRTLLRAAWDDFQAGTWDGAHTLYALWIYEVWQRKFALS